MAEEQQVDGGVRPARAIQKLIGAFLGVSKGAGRWD
jgi:hypothetical protein